MEASVKKRQSMARLHILDSVLSGVVVLYATYLIRNFGENRILLCVLFLLLAAESAIRMAEGERTRTHRFCVMALYLVGAVLIVALSSFHGSLLAASAVELAVIVFNRIMAILKKPKKRKILLNVFCILIVLMVGFVVFVGDMVINESIDISEDDQMSEYDQTSIRESIEKLEATDDSFLGYGSDLLLYLYLLVIVLLRMILHVVGISVSQMKLNVLMNIIRETYVLEILLGLLLMIIVCSTVFLTIEDSMSDYGDALWYSFALVTTIGFGDITATTIIGRVLSVFLGMYGIVVVAIITSVIVNFYGEMRRIVEHKTDEEDKTPEEDE